MARLVSLIILAVLIAVLGATFYQVIVPFLLPLFLAGVAAVLCEPLFAYFRRRTNGRTRLAAGLTTGAVLAMFIVPLLTGVFVGSVQLYTLTQRTLDDHTWNEAADWVHGKVTGWEIYDRIQPWLFQPDADSESSDAVDQTPADETVQQPVEPADQQQPVEATTGPEAGRTPMADSTEAGAMAQPEPEAQTPEQQQADTTQPGAQDDEDSESLEQLPESSTADNADELKHADIFRQQLPENVRKLLQSIAERSLGIAGRTIDTTLDILGTLVFGLVGMMMFVIALYYFLADGPKLIAAAEGLIPVHVDYQRTLLKQFDVVIRAVVLATFLAAISQGLATALALYVVGFHRFFIIFIVSTLSAMVPLAGTWLVWGPCAIWLACQGQWGACIFLVVFGAGVISILDNVIRTYVLQSDAKLHPLLAFVSVLGGLKVMGLWGVFFGPIAACCLHALIQIFNTELKSFSLARSAQMDEQKRVLVQETEPVPVEKTRLPEAGCSQDTGSPSDQTSGQDSASLPPEQADASRTTAPSTDSVSRRAAAQQGAAEQSSASDVASDSDETDRSGDREARPEEPEA